MSVTLTYLLMRTFSVRVALWKLTSAFLHWTTSREINQSYLIQFYYFIDKAVKYEHLGKDKYGPTVYINNPFLVIRKLRKISQIL